MNLAILGAGSVRCSVPVIASIATYFGERPLDIRLYDADEERLDLFDRFARTVFAFNKNPHRVRTGIDAKELLEDVDRVILQVGRNCARKEAKAAGAKVLTSETDRISASLARLLKGFESNAAVMSLQHNDVVVPLDHYYRLDWTLEVDNDERRALPHQVLRWIRGEEDLFALFAQYDRSPLKQWLDDVSCAMVVSDN